MLCTLTDFKIFFKGPKSFTEDGIDRLSSWIGTNMMLIFCTIATAGFGFGNHFECIIPGDYNPNWQSFVVSYCYAQPHFYVDNSDGVLLPEIYYFPWLPYFFLGHAIVFYLPRILWHILSGICGIDLDCILNAANVINKVDKEDEKKGKTAALAAYLVKAIDSSPGFQKNYLFISSTALLFFVKKFLYAFGACVQFYVICYYIGKENLYWGFEVLSHSWLKHGYFSSRFFSLFTFCRAPNAHDNIFESKDINCLLGMNVIYEKLYVFTYFLLLGIIIASLLSALYYTILFIITPLRINFIDGLLGLKQSNIPVQHIDAFIYDFLGDDGYLSLLLIEKNIGQDIAREILKELWNRFTNDYSFLYKKRTSFKNYGPLTSTPNRYAPIPMATNGNNKYMY